MVGLYRLTAEVERRKLMFIHKILHMPNDSVSQRPFLRNYLIYITDKTKVKLGFIPDICSLLCKYNLQYIVNDYIRNPALLPSKYTWENIVKRAVYDNEKLLWNERINVDSDFEYFKILHCDIKPAMLYELSKDYAYSITVNKIAKLWARSVSIQDKNCSYCGAIYQDYISHIVATCLISSDIRNVFYEDIRMISGTSLLDNLKHLQEKELIVKLLGANIPPYVNNEVYFSFLKRSYKFIIDCYQYCE